MSQIASIPTEALDKIAHQLGKAIIGEILAHDAAERTMMKNDRLEAELKALQPPPADPAAT